MTKQELQSMRELLSFLGGTFGSLIIAAAIAGGALSLFV